MFCTQCRSPITAQSQYCATCGQAVAAVTPAVTSPSQTGVGFGQAIAICLTKFFDFSGRASRPEYWYFYLFTIGLGAVAQFLDPTQMLALLINAVLLIPTLSAGARRLHDTGRSGWWQLLLLTIIGILPLIYWLARKGEAQANAYGQPV